MDRKDRLDLVVATEVGAHLLAGSTGASAADSPALSALLAESAALSARRTETTELLFVAGVDRARVQKELVAIDQRAGEVEAAISRERGAQATSGLAESVRALWDAAATDVAGFDDFRAFWDGLPVERQRDLVRAWFTVTVRPAKQYPGLSGEERDYARVSVEALNCAP